MTYQTNNDKLYSIDDIQDFILLSQRQRCRIQGCAYLPNQNGVADDFCSYCGLKRQKVPGHEGYGIEINPATGEYKANTYHG